MQVNKLFTHREARSPANAARTNRDSLDPESVDQAAHPTARAVCRPSSLRDTASSKICAKAWASSGGSSAIRGGAAGHRRPGHRRKAGRRKRRSERQALGGAARRRERRRLGGCELRLAAGRNGGGEISCAGCRRDRQHPMRGICNGGVGVGSSRGVKIGCGKSPIAAPTITKRGGGRSIVSERRALTQFVESTRRRIFDRHRVEQQRDRVAKIFVRRDLREGEDVLRKCPL